VADYVQDEYSGGRGGTLGDDVTAWETWLDGPIVLPGGQNGFNLSDLGVI
jgi:hypothetical protein